MSLSEGQDNEGLGRSAARGAKVTLFGQVARVVIVLTGMVILARLLTPSDYGVLAMVIAVTGVGEVVRDFGLSFAAVQAKTLNRQQQSNLFWVNVALGGALTVLFIGLAPLIAHFYDDQRLIAVTQILATTFLLNGLATQFQAGLNRRMSFHRLAVVEVAGPAAGLLVAIMLALSGAGYWSLVAQQVVTAFLALVLLICLSSWMPGPYDRRTSIGSFLRYGGNLLGMQLLGYASRNVSSVIIGARLGAEALGYYDRAFQIVMLPLNQLNAPATRVALPVLSRLNGDRTRYESFLLAGQGAMTHVLVALMAFMAATAAPLLGVVFGEDWLPAAPLLQILCLAGAAQAVSYATYWVFLSKGLTGSNLRYALVTRPFVIAAVLLGAVWGAQGVAAGYALSLLALWPFGIYWVTRRADVSAVALFWNGLRPFLVYGTAGALSGLALFLLPPMDPWIEVLVSSLVFSLSLMAIFAIWRQYRNDIRSILSTVKLSIL